MGGWAALISGIAQGLGDASLQQRAFRMKAEDEMLNVNVGMAKQMMVADDPKVRQIGQGLFTALSEHKGTPGETSKIMSKFWKDHEGFAQMLYGTQQMPQENLSQAAPAPQNAQTFNAATPPEAGQSDIDQYIHQGRLQLDAIDQQLKNPGSVNPITGKPTWQAEQLVKQRDMLEQQLVGFQNHIMMTAAADDVRRQGILKEQRLLRDDFEKDVEPYMRQNGFDEDEIFHAKTMWVKGKALPYKRNTVGGSKAQVWLPIPGTKDMQLYLLDKTDGTMMVVPGAAKPFTAAFQHQRYTNPITGAITEYWDMNPAAKPWVEGQQPQGQAAPAQEEPPSGYTPLQKPSEGLTVEPPKESIQDVTKLAKTPAPKAAAKPAAAKPAAAKSTGAGTSAKAPVRTWADEDDPHYNLSKIEQSLPPIDTSTPAGQEESVVRSLALQFGKGNKTGISTTAQKARVAQFMQKNKIIPVQNRLELNDITDLGQAEGAIDGIIKNVVQQARAKGLKANITASQVSGGELGSVASLFSKQIFREAGMLTEQDIRRASALLPWNAPLPGTGLRFNLSTWIQPENDLIKLLALRDFIKNRKKVMLKNKMGDFDYSINNDDYTSDPKGERRFGTKPANELDNIEKWRQQARTMLNEGVQQPGTIPNPVVPKLLDKYAPKKKAS